MPGWSDLNSWCSLHDLPASFAFACDLLIPMTFSLKKCSFSADLGPLLSCHYPKCSVLPSLLPHGYSLFWWSICWNASSSLDSWGSSCAAQVTTFLLPTKPARGTLQLPFSIQESGEKVGIVRIITQKPYLQSSFLHLLMRRQWKFSNIHTRIPVCYFSTIST